MTRTGKLIRDWGIGLYDRAGRIRLTKDITESLVKHQHRNVEALRKCHECADTLGTPYEVADFRLGVNMEERVLTSWLGEIDGEGKHTHRKLRWWLGPDRYVDLCYAVAQDYGTGPFGDGGSLE